MQKEKEELDIIIEKLEAMSSVEDAFFLYDYEVSIKKSGFIHSNKEGLILYAKELLKASKRFEDFKLNKSEEETIFLETSDWYLHGKKRIIPYIKPIYKSRKLLKEPISFKEKIKEKISLISYFLTIIIIVGLVFIGFLQTIDWIKNLI